MDKDTVDLTFLAKQSERILAQMSEIKADIADLKSDVSELKSDVAELKSDVAYLKSDVAELKSDVAELKTNVAELKSDVAYLKSDAIETKSTIGKIIDAVTVIASVQEQHSDILMKINKSQRIVERDLSVLKMRVERIEEHVGLVEA